jgi:hypothetical protein
MTATSDTNPAHHRDGDGLAFENLAAVESIKRLKARYFRHLDTKDWEAFRQVFADDAVIGPIDSGLPSTTKPIDGMGPDEFLARVCKTLKDVTSAHHGHMPEIELTSPTEARGVWAMEDLLVFPADAPVRRLRGLGHYHETYVKGAEGWKIASLGLTRLHVDLETGD